MAALQCRSLFDSKKMRLFDILNILLLTPENGRFCWIIYQQKQSMFYVVSDPPVGVVFVTLSVQHFYTHLHRKAVAEIGAAAPVLTGFRFVHLCTALLF
jgi:hypothetical protein